MAGTGRPETRMELAGSAAAAALLAQLNPEQRRAVEHGEGPLLVIAGAGSGKTRVLTYRIAHLIGVRGVPPWRILAVTFTNKAAQEMKDRVEHLIGGAASGLWIGTFHAVCGQILRREASLLGYTSHFLIFDTTDQLGVIRESMKELNIDSKRFEPRSVLATISRAKNELIGPLAFSSEARDYPAQRIADIYLNYQERLRKANAMDFDDLLLNTVLLFRNHPDVLEKYQDKFDHILVDEYQDTNHAQYILVKLLAAKHQNVCVVGDEDQSIYSFRGADIRNILDFERDYPHATVIKLEENYRSTQSILEAANQVISHNLSRKSKRLWTRNSRGSPVRLFAAPDEQTEAGFVAAEIERRIREEGRGFQDFTILYRTHAQSRVFEEVFIRRAIPYRIVAGLRFYERKEIKDILAYLRVIANPADDFSLRRIANVPPRGLGETTLDRLEAWGALRGLPMYEVLRFIYEDEKSGRHAEDSPAELPAIRGKARQAVVQLYELLESLRRAVPGRQSASTEGNAPVSRLSKFVDQVFTDSGYREYLASEKTEEAAGRRENVEEFLNMVKQFETSNPEAGLDELLEHVALVSDVDAYDPQANAVTMMTFHAAKGLEFPVVFMVGMEEGIFPHSRSLWGDGKREGDIEEERRLCYVGMTRAKEDLYFTYARSRTQYGGSSSQLPSSFLSEIDRELLMPVDLHGRPTGEETRATSDWMLEAGWRGGSRSEPELPPSTGIGHPPGPERRTTLRAGSRTRPGARSSAAAGASTGSTGEATVSPDVTELAPADLRPGDHVRHAHFGAGTVVSVQPVGTDGRDAFVMVAFEGKGVRKLLLSMARLTREDHS